MKINLVEIAEQAVCSNKVVEPAQSRHGAPVAIERHSRSMGVQDFLPDDVGEAGEELPKAALSAESVKRKPPSVRQLNIAYDWFCSTPMVERLRAKLRPPLSCSFLVDYLPEELLETFDRDGELSWRQWHTILRRLSEPSTAPSEAETLSQCAALETRQG